MSVSFLHTNLQTIKLVLYTFVVQLLFITQLVCQNNIQEAKIDSFSLDTTLETTKVLPFDTVDINIKDDDIKSPVHYKALDSIVYDVENKMLYLYGNAEMKYDKTQVNSANVTFDWNTQTLMAEGIDSFGKKIETPILVQEGKTYEANKMEYNFRTLKGKIYDVVTEDNGAFIHSEIVIKTKDNSWLSDKAKYTTCTDKEHPHFYILAKKAKVIPDKIMVSGPADLVISGINTPLALPFAIFPINSGRRSGLIIPQFGTDPNDRTFRFIDGGYYWAVNDYLSMAFTGTMSTGGSFGFKVASDYKKRYKYNGNLLMSFGRKMPSDPIANKGEKATDYKIRWTHNMDSKADPNNKFSASVNFETNSYNKNALVQDERILNVINSSHITYTRLFSGKPYNLKISANHNQNNKTNTLSITLPEAIFSINRITPFKAKISSKNKKFYEKIGFKYSIRGKAVANAVDTTFFTEETLKDINYGIKQNLNISASYSIFKNFNFTPRFDYNELWMFKKETQFYEEHYAYNSDTISDTLYSRAIFDNGFYARRNFSTGASINTRLKGIYRFNAGAIKAMRHVFTPTLTYTYKPDFSLPNWNYFDEYYNEHAEEDKRYNQFQGAVYSTGINIGETNMLSLALDNSLEIKVLNKKDTANMFKKIPILKSFRISTGYNFAGDSIRKFQDVNISASTSFLNNMFGLRGSLKYNPYSVDMKNNKISKMYMETHQKPLRFVSLDINFDMNLRPKKKKKETKINSEYGSIEDLEYIASNPDLYYDFEIPWSFRASYHMQLTNGINNVKRDTTILGLGSITFGGYIKITPKWTIDASSGYDIKAKDLTITTFRLVRDLHCWEMSLNYTAYPIRYQNFNFQINVKSALLQDLKITKKYQRNNYNSSF